MEPSLIIVQNQPGICLRLVFSSQFHAWWLLLNPSCFAVHALLIWWQPTEPSLEWSGSQAATLVVLSHLALGLGVAIPSIEEPQVQQLFDFSVARGDMRVFVRNAVRSFCGRRLPTTFFRAAVQLAIPGRCCTLTESEACVELSSFVNQPAVELAHGQTAPAHLKLVCSGGAYVSLAFLRVRGQRSAVIDAINAWFKGLPANSEELKETTVATDAAIADSDGSAQLGNFADIDAKSDGNDIALPLLNATERAASAV